MQKAKPSQTHKIIVSYAQDADGEDWMMLGHLPPEQKAAIMMDMTSACV